MPELHQPTLLINAGGQGSSVKVRKPSRAGNKYRRSKWRVLKHLGMTLMLILIVGLGAWKFAGTTANIDDEESIADLEGFESAPQFLKSPDGRDNSTAQLGEAASLPPLSENELLTWDPGTLSPPITNETTDSAHVWLNGIIEEPESAEKIELPTRLSGGSNDSSILR